ncbi:transglutaminase domain-containing protein [Sediminibacterium sp.]|jgi:hypothetical protein|uniref:transglutaminase domain-containing protein n=1 Tax=Sediminibacterium sp. TaxID=1917865 RepID=UPI0025EE6DEC|nr:transglutaminase domain-containing protein [Sediminibacterium sp.]MBW0176553.1 DUF3857 domain-containing protein [Sediminibacterium sp.]
MKQIAIIILLNILTTYVSAQNRPNIKFGKIESKDFAITSPVVDSGDAAIVLSDIASTDFEGNNNGDFSLVFKHHKRVLIRKRTAFDEATVSIQLYSGGNTISTERLTDLQASTFFIENGQLVEKKLNKDDVLTEKVNSELSIRKFTLPDIKEGCIIEYEYAVKSPYYSRLKSWTFQDNYPVLWSEYTVSIPFIFDYLTTSYGYLPYTINQGSKKFKTYTIRIPSSNAGMSSDVLTLSGEATTNTWAIKDIPAFKAESFISTASNHISRIHFQLRAIKYSETNVSYVVKDWYSTASDLMKDPDFSKEIYDDNGWLKDEVKRLMTLGDDVATTKKIFEFIRDNYTCSDYDARWLSQPLKKTYQSKTGNVADINMLLTAMLKKAGYYAVPVLLSTRDNGIVNETVALLNQYNYVIARVELAGQVFLLDASRPKIGFGDLPTDCYNRSARIIDRMPALVTLDADSISNVDIISVQLTNDTQGKMKGGYYGMNGKFTSMSFRDKFLGKKNEEIMKEITEGYPQGFSFENLSIDSFKIYDFPLTVKYDIKADMGDGDEDIIYFNPMLKEGYEKNLFVSAERLYPVEMPFCLNETYLLTMEIPKGYRVEEMPKSARVNFNDNEGSFEYIIAKQGDNIMLRSKLFFKKALFAPEDYEVLRNFFGFIVKKHAEQIVFKKN